MDKRILIYHPLRWREIHPPWELDDLYDNEISSVELTEFGLTKETLDKTRLAHDGFESVIEVFEKTGSNIFHLQPSLVEMFRNSSVDEIILDNLKTPFELFYVYFGPASRLQMEGDDAYIDGAYIWNTSFTDNEASFSITLTSSLDPEKALQLPWLQRLARDTGFHFSLGAFKGSEVTVREAFDEHFVNPYEKLGRETYESLNAEWAKEFPGFKFSKSYDESLSSWETDPKYRDPALRPALNLAINAVCYLAYEKREVVERYPDFAPERLVRQATTGSTLKEQKRGRSKLDSIGFRKVFYCGDSIERHSAQTHRKGGSEVSAHWRRGHWRNQAHGTGQSLRKLIWIKPVLVNEGSGEAGGHIYHPKSKEPVSSTTGEH